MSTLAIAYTVISTVVSCVVYFRQRAKIKQLRAGNKNWRSIAIHRGKELENCSVKLSAITGAYQVLSAGVHDLTGRLNSASAEAAQRSKELAAIEQVMRDNAAATALQSFEQASQAS